MTFNNQNQFLKFVACFTFLNSVQGQILPLKLLALKQTAEGITRNTLAAFTDDTWFSTFLIAAQDLIEETKLPKELQDPLLDVVMLMLPRYQPKLNRNYNDSFMLLALKQFSYLDYSIDGINLSKLFKRQAISIKKDIYGNIKLNNSKHPSISIHAINILSSTSVDLEYCGFTTHNILEGKEEGRWILELGKSIEKTKTRSLKNRIQIFRSTPMHSLSANLLVKGGLSDNLNITFENIKNTKLITQVVLSKTILQPFRDQVYSTKSSIIYIDSLLAAIKSSSSDNCIDEDLAITIFNKITENGLVLRKSLYTKKILKQKIEILRTNAPRFTECLLAAESARKSAKRVKKLRKMTRRETTLLDLFHIAQNCTLY